MLGSQLCRLRRSWESAHFHLGKFYDQRYGRMTVAEKGHRYVTLF